MQLDQLKLLVSKESTREITQYYVKIWPNKKQVQITNYPHPYPQLALLQKEVIRYQREDGVKLTATLYLPPGYSPSEDGPLPCLIWSYPGEFKSKEAAGQVRRSPNKFARISNNFPLLWLARGYICLAWCYRLIYAIVKKLLCSMLNLFIIQAYNWCIPQVCYSCRPNNSYHWWRKSRGKWQVVL